MNKLRRIFCPTLFERQEDIAFLNSLIEQDIRKNGENCSNCAHKLDVQQSPYYDYTTCKFDKTLEFGYGKTNHRCDKYQRLLIGDEEE